MAIGNSFFSLIVLTFAWPKATTAALHSIDLSFWRMSTTWIVIGATVIGLAGLVISAAGSDSAHFASAHWQPLTYVFEVGSAALLICAGIGNYVATRSLPLAISLTSLQIMATVVVVYSLSLLASALAPRRPSDFV